MALKPSLRRRHRKQESTDINVTPFIDILVCLMLFLFLTAVFGKAAILNIYLPTEEEGQSAAAAPKAPSVIPTVAVTRDGFLFNPGQGAPTRLPLKDGDYDYASLQAKLIDLKKNAGSSDNIIILPESGILYQSLISTMDTCRQFTDDAGKPQVLFPTISLGEFQTAKANQNGATP